MYNEQDDEISSEITVAYGTVSREERGSKRASDGVAPFVLTCPCKRGQTTALPYGNARPSVISCAFCKADFCAVFADHDHINEHRDQSIDLDRLLKRQRTEILALFCAPTVGEAAKAGTLSFDGVPIGSSADRRFSFKPKTGDGERAANGVPIVLLAKKTLLIVGYLDSSISEVGKIVYFLCPHGKGKLTCNCRETPLLCGTFEKSHHKEEFRAPNARKNSSVSSKTFFHLVAIVTTDHKEYLIRSEPLIAISNKEYFEVAKKGDPAMLSKPKELRLKEKTSIESKEPQDGLDQGYMNVLDLESDYQLDRAESVGW